MKAHVVTRIDLVRSGYNPTNVYVFSTRENAVAKMKKLYLAELERNGITDPGYEDEFVHGDFSNPPYLPYAYCHDVYIDYYDSEIDAAI